VAARDNTSWTNLREVYHPADAMLQMWDDYGNLDFNSVGGYPNTDRETEVQGAFTCLSAPCPQVHQRGGVGSKSNGLQAIRPLQVL